jgi:hypothetical protein
MLSVFGRLPDTGVSECTEAGVRKASGEETAGELSPVVVSIYGDLAAVFDLIWGLRTTAPARMPAVGSFGMDVVAPQRDRAREGLRKLDLVIFAVTINVNDSLFTAFGQHTALALDRMPESHDAEFRDAAAFANSSALR